MKKVRNLNLNHFNLYCPSSAAHHEPIFEFLPGELQTQLPSYHLVMKGKSKYERVGVYKISLPLPTIKS